MAEIPNLYTEQAAAHVTALLQFGSYISDITGSLLQFLTEGIELELGVTSQLFKAQAELVLMVITDS